MKSIGWLSFMILLLTVSQSCKKISTDNPADQGSVPMGKLVIAPGFNWKTTSDVTFIINSDNATLVSITSEDGSMVYHKGFFNRLLENYEITLSLPSYVRNVMVNGQLVPISGSTVQVSLASLKSAGISSGNINPVRMIPDQGLVSAWHFNENTGTAASDAKGLNNGIVSGAEWVPGINNSALDFDGTGGHVQVPYSASINNTTNQISLSCWFKMNLVGDNGAFVFNRVKYMLRLDPQGRVSFSIYNPTFTSLVMDYIDRILDTDWHHAVATYDGAEMKIFIDGVQKKSLATTGNLQTSTSDLYIGNQSTLNFFPGILDEVLLYSRPLTQDDILSIFTQTPNPGNGSNLISEWPLNENSGTTVTDVVSANNGTITGATWAPGVSGSALYFNGTTDWVKVPKAANMNVTNAITMMLWVKSEENRTAKLFQKGDWDGPGIGQDKWNGWQGGVRLSNGTSQTIDWGDGLPLLNEWYHIAVTYDGANLKLYINGQLKKTKAVTGTLAVNNRDISFGADNGAQKFFKGSLDEIKLFGSALTQTEIQANFQGHPVAPDQDGDGIADADDSYPKDPARAFNNYFPSNGYASLAFEDLWPGMGDYDFNDLVVDYQFNTVTNGSNKVTEVLATFVLRAIGAGFNNGFGFQLPGLTLVNSDVSVSGYNLKESYITLKDNGTEANQEKVTVIVFDNANKILVSTSGFGVNVHPNEPYVEPDTMVVTLAVTPNKYSVADLDLIHFNPFLIVDGARGKEIHLPGYKPTTLADLSLLGTGEDDSKPATGKYYQTKSNLPWAINIASTYQYTIESNQITNGYTHFAAWAESSGALFQDWYLDKPGYRNNSAIYQIP
ncbi:MAG: LruC domain-containing protein [Bacteroidales bacterium]